MEYTYFPFKKKPYICVEYNAFSFPGNYHSEIEITYCVKGTIPYTIKSKRYDITAGQFLVIGSGEKHERLIVDGQSRGIFIKFGTLLLGSGFTELSGLRFSNPLVDLNDPSTPEYIREGFKILSENAMPNQNAVPDAEKDWLIRSVLYRLVLYLLNDMPKKSPANVSQSQDEIKKRKMINSVENAMSYIEDNYSSQISLEDVSTMLGYEKNYFCKMFKEATGQGFHQFLNHYRIQTACGMLASPDIAIGDIASACGFPQFKTFCRVFKADTGLTPSQYRENLIL